MSWQSRNLQFILAKIDEKYVVPMYLVFFRSLVKNDKKSDLIYFILRFCLSNIFFLMQACAPRYVYFSINKRRREPVGTCFTATDSFSKFSEYSPCRTGKYQNSLSPCTLGIFFGILVMNNESFQTVIFFLLFESSLSWNSRKQYFSTQKYFQTNWKFKKKIFETYSQKNPIV